MTSPCPQSELFHALADSRDETLSDGEREQLWAHVEQCPDCATAFDEAKRFRTLLLKTRVPSLSEGQWAVLEDRVSLLSSELSPTGSSIGAKLYWGLAIAATVTICVVGAMELSKERPKGVDGFLSPTGRARVAAAIQPLRLTATEGPGQLTTADGSFQALGAGAELAGGAQVRSGSRSVRLVVADNFEVNLAPNSLLTLEASNGREVFLRLRRGSVSCQVAKRRPGQRFGVLAGSYRVSVVGTEFTVSYPRVGDVSVEVSEGAVRVDEAATPWRRPGDTTMVVRAGHRWRAHGGKLEMGPVKHTAPPVADSATEPEVKPEVPAVAPVVIAKKRTRAAAVKKPKSRPTVRRTSKAPARVAPAKRRDKNITITLPPQRMSDDEVRRAKATEQTRNQGLKPGSKVGPKRPRAQPASRR